MLLFYKNKFKPMCALEPYGPSLRGFAAVYQILPKDQLAKRLQSCVSSGSKLASSDNSEPRSRRFTLPAHLSGAYGKRLYQGMGESFAGTRKAKTSYIESIIIHRSQKNKCLTARPSKVEARAAGGFGAKQKPNSLQLEQLERHESGVFRIDKDLSTKPTSLKATIRLEHTCGDFSLIGEFSNAQEHCLQKFINLCMKHGKKNKSYKIISNTLQRLILAEPSSHKPSPVGSSYYDRFTLKGHGIHASLNAATPKMEDSTLRELLGDRAFPASRKLVLLMNAIENVKPIVEVKKVRISGTTQLVPSIIPKNRQICLAIRWIVEAAISRRNTKKSMTLDECFFAELIDASQNIGTVRKRRDDLHKLAESNRGFAHYRWW